MNRVTEFFKAEEVSAASLITTMGVLARLCNSRQLVGKDVEAALQELRQSKAVAKLVNEPVKLTWVYEKTAGLSRSLWGATGMHSANSDQSLFEIVTYKFEHECSCRHCIRQGETEIVYRLTISANDETVHMLDFDTLKEAKSCAEHFHKVGELRQVDAERRTPVTNLSMLAAS